MSGPTQTGIPDAAIEAADAAVPTSAKWTEELVEHWPSVNRPGFCCCGAWAGETGPDYADLHMAHVAAVVWGAINDRLRAALVAARPFLIADAQAAERERIATAARHWADNFGVNVSDDEGDWWDGYRQAQREAVHKAAEFAAQLEESTDDR